MENGKARIIASNKLCMSFTQNLHGESPRKPAPRSRIPLKGHTKGKLEKLRVIAGLIVERSGEAQHDGPERRQPESRKAH
jgi:hypothetical protein